MNKDEIDELLHTLSSIDEKDMYKIYEVTQEEFEKLTDEQLEEHIIKIDARRMSEIEKGDYEYFIEKFEDINYSNLISYFIEFESQSESKEKTEWKNSIKKQVLYKIRDSKTIDEKRKYDFIPLIKSIKDKDFFKECIEKKDGYGFNGYDIVRIIRLVEEDEFTKECINRRDELGLDGTDIIECIKEVKDTEYKINTIINWRNYTDSKFDLIKLIKSVEYFKNLDIYDNLSFDLPENPIDYIIDTLQQSATDELIVIIKQLGLNGDKLIESLIIDNSNLIKKSSPEFLIEFWNIISDDLKEKCCAKIINTLQQKDATDELVSIIKDLGLNEDKLIELLTIEDADYLKKHIINNIISRGINDKGVKLDDLNEEIDKLYSVFLTTNLPTIFKEFEFFKNHNNYGSMNYNLYEGKSISERDANIRNDLFRIALESNNKQLRTFLENLYNGNIALTKKQNGEKVSEIDEALILKYRDVLYDLLDHTEDNNIKKSEDIYADFEKIKEFLNIEDENIGEILLNRYFDKIGINCVKINNSAVLKLLEYMDLRKENSQRRNIQEFELEVGDLIKGTDIEFIEDILKNGIRAKEFFMEGKLDSDCTPLDADFSEIKSENLAKDNLAGIIDSTYTGSTYGKTWIVIKNNDYNSEDRDLNYAHENGTNSTRYFRTGIGSTNISAIITAEWNDELKFVLAQNEFYIPVKDFETEEILFTFDEYQKIRQQMSGLTHYGVDEFVISENANNENILNQASELRKKAEGEISTEEKREKIISQLRSKFKKVLLTEIGGDISKETIELIDTGSTGRGTNIPGDGDFDFMLKCSSIEEQKELIKEIKTIFVGNEKGGTNEFNIRYTDVKIEGLEPTVEVDITTQSKRLETEYTSDMCIREKLDSIKRTYGDEQLNVVIDNILVAKKVLKENGLYKKTCSIGSTGYGGFGGIGVENWILQNGGSFINAMQTFLENTIDEDGNEIEFEKFKKRYPIYDFGQNHMYKKGNSGDKREHDHYIEGLSECGFTKMKEFFKTLLAEYNLEQSKESNKEKFFDSIIDEIKEPNGYKMSDMSQIYGLLAKMRAYCITKESKGENLEI